MIKMPIKKRSKEERDKSARAVAKTINTTTPTHGRPGSWGNTPGLFGEEVLEPELEIVEIVQEMALEAETEVTIVKGPLTPGTEEYEAEQPVEAETVEEMKAEVETLIKESNIPEEVKKDIVVEVVKEQPLEAEPEQVTDQRPPKAEIDKTAKEAEIEALKAKLAELTK